MNTGEFHASSDTSIPTLMPSRTSLPDRTLRTRAVTALRIRVTIFSAVSRSAYKGKRQTHRQRSECGTFSHFLLENLAYLDQTSSPTLLPIGR